MGYNAQADSCYWEGNRMKPAVARVHAALKAAGLDTQIVEFDESTRTAQEAAAAIGTQVEQIVKSLVFLADGEPILVLASGVNRVDTGKLGAQLGKRITRANADQARAATGFVIGGTPPVGHPAPLPIVIDQDLLHYAEIWAAAGTPNAVFVLSPDDLLRITNGEPRDIRVD